MEIVPLVALVPVVIGVVAVIRKTFEMPVRFAPITSLILGTIGAVAFNGFTVTAVVAGIVTGLVSCGLYSGTKTTVQG